MVRGQRTPGTGSSRAALRSRYRCAQGWRRSIGWCRLLLSLDERL